MVAVFLELTPYIIVSVSVLEKLGISFSILSGSFTNLYAQLQQALGASYRIFELLDINTDLSQPKNPRNLKQVDGHLSIDEVTFFYKDRPFTPTLKDLTLEACPGEVIALVGPSGAGKSTLITLIPRFYDPTKGSIKLVEKTLEYCFSLYVC